MKIKLALSSLFLFVGFSTSAANKVEYICWAPVDANSLPTAFDSASISCGNETKTIGGKEGKVACVLPSMCQPLTTGLKATIEEKTGKSYQKLTSEEIFKVMKDENISGQFSNLMCEGSGKVENQGPGKYSSIRCPAHSECANQGVFYKMGMGMQPVSSDPFTTNEEQRKVDDAQPKKAIKE
jgi:hypothetical protein